MVVFFICLIRSFWIWIKFLLVLEGKNDWYFLGQNWLILVKVSEGAKEERKERCYQNPVDSRRVFVGGYCTRQVQCTMGPVQCTYLLHSIKLNCYATHILLCFFKMPIFIVKLKTGEVKLDGTLKMCYTILFPVASFFINYIVAYFHPWFVYLQGLPSGFDIK